MASEHEAMHRYLEHILENAENGVAPVQIVFVPGAVQAAGAMRKGPVDGTFQLCYPAPVGRNGAAIARGADSVMVYDTFTAAGVLRVIRTADTPESAIEVPGPGLVTPGRPS